MPVPGIPSVGPGRRLKKKGPKTTQPGCLGSRPVPAQRWWSEGVHYQVYPRSWADSDGDGVGDLRGIIDRLDHLAWLGIDGIWLSPITVSPDADWGYDVADYTGVQPGLGTMDELDELIAAATRRELQIILDLVPNHTSIEHPW